MANVQSIALCRVSTKKQLDDGNTAPQVERVKQAANYLDAELVKMWELAVSSRKGKNVNRKDLREMLAYCRLHKKVKYLIVDEADRFMRSIEEYYWWKMEFKRIGVRLILANRPDVDPDDDRAVFDELIDVYRAEQSNNERITKTPEKQKQRILLGYYPGNPPAGYKKGIVSGLPDPDDIFWPMIRDNLKEVLTQQYTLAESLKHLTNAGYRTRNFGPRAKGGQKIDMNRYKSLICNPFYAGVIEFGSYDVRNQNILHETMITLEEHAKIVAIVNKTGRKFTVKRDNPLFPLNNLMSCIRCGEDMTKQMLVGYTHNNGKKGNSFHKYNRYRCRSCNKSILRDKVHESLNEVLERLILPPEHYSQLKRSLRKAWSKCEADKLGRIASKNAVLADLKSKKLKLIDSLATNPDLVEDIREAIEQIKLKITNVEDELVDESDIERDFMEFCDFAIDYVKSWSDSWWLLDKEQMARCKQIIFPAGFAINEYEKVSTPEISIVFRGEDNEEVSKDADFLSLEGPVGLEPTTPCLKGRCSNRLSYGPAINAGGI
jgi:DNA invertase Pin-like site-specific DNA recombinase